MYKCIMYSTFAWPSYTYLYPKGWYMNDPRESMLALETLRKEIRTLHSSDASSTGEARITPSDATSTGEARFTPENPPGLNEVDSAVPAPPTAPPSVTPTVNVIPDTLGSYGVILSHTSKQTRN